MSFNGDRTAILFGTGPRGTRMLCTALGITPEAREDHSAYIGHWLKVLKDDRRATFQAAAHAQRAVDYLHALQKREAAAA